MRNKISAKITGLTVLAATIIATTSFAQSEPVYSVNIIGMQKVTVPSAASGGYTLISMPFEQVIPNLDSVVGTNGVANFSSSLADQVLIYDSITQQFKIFWLFTDRKWVSTSGYATNIYLEPGSGAWYLSRSETSENITMVGDVVNADSVTNQINPGLQILSYPYSSPVVISDLALTNGAAGFTSAVADNLMTYNPDSSSFSIYWLFSDRKWVSSAGYATNITINPGSAFWYLSRSSNSYSWVENKPYEL